MILFHDYLLGYHRFRSFESIEMRRSTRNSLVGVHINENHEKFRSFSTKFSLPSFTKRVKKLTDEQREAIRSVGFGNLLEIPNQMLSKKLLVELMERWSCDKCVFVLPPGELAIIPMDVALILGLRVCGRPVILSNDELVSDLEQDYGVTFWNRKITVAYLEARLNSIGTNADDDFIRTFLLFCFGTFLFPDGSGKVNSCFLSLLENLDEVRHLAWGAVVLDDILLWLNKRKHGNIQSIGGCLIFLQIWAYEHIDINQPKELDSRLLFPRACKWKNSRQSQRQSVISEKFKGLQTRQITWTLLPTSSELEINIIKELVVEKEIKIEEQISNNTLIEEKTTIETQISSNIELGEQTATEAQISNSVELGDQTKIEAQISDNSLDCCSMAREVDYGNVWNLEGQPRSKQGPVAGQSSNSNYTVDWTSSMLEPEKDAELESLCGESTVDTEALKGDELEKGTVAFQEENIKLKRDIDELKNEVRALRNQLQDIPALKEQNKQLKCQVEDLRREKQHQSFCTNHLVVQLEKLFSDDHAEALETT